MVGNDDVYVAYLKARFFLAALYQPLKRLATIVTPRWGFALQLVLRRVEANKLLIVNC